MIRNHTTNRLVKFGGSHYKDLLKRQTADPSRKYFLKKDIARLRRRVTRGGGDDDDLYTCPICLDNERENPHMIAVWPCGHLFCEMCIREYCFGKNLCVCPTCRQKIVEPKKLLNEQRRPESWGEAEVMRMSTKDQRTLANRQKRKEAAKADPVSQVHHYKRYELFFNMYMNMQEIARDNLSKHVGGVFQSITSELLAKNEALANREKVRADIFSIVYSINQHMLNNRPVFEKLLKKRTNVGTVCTFKLDVVFKFYNTHQTLKRTKYVSQLVKNVREIFNTNTSGIDDARPSDGNRVLFDLVEYTPGEEWTSNDTNKMLDYLTGLHRDYQIKNELLIVNDRLRSIKRDVERLKVQDDDSRAIARQLKEHEDARERCLEKIRELNPRGHGPINTYVILIKDNDDTKIRNEIDKLRNKVRGEKGKAPAVAGPSGVRDRTFYTEYALDVNYVMIFDKGWLNEEMRRDLTFAKSLQNHVEAADTLERSHILLRINGAAHDGVFVHSIIVKKRRAAAPLSDVVSKGWRDYLNTEGANPNMHARALMTFNVELVLGCKLVDQGEREIALSRALGDLSVNRADADGLFSDASRVGFRYAFDMADPPDTIARWTSNDDLAVNAHVQKMVAATKEKSGALNFYHRPRSL